MTAPTKAGFVLSFPALAGMHYPRLKAAYGIVTAADENAVLALPEDERHRVRVFMTSATRGCSLAMADALPNLRFVVSQGAGQDKFDLSGLAARGVRVRNIGEGLTEDVADLAMALTQMLARDLLKADHFARSGQWQNGRFGPGESLVGKTMGIAGLSGRIGQAIARRARAAQMAIATLRRPSTEKLDATLYDGFLELAGASDVLVLAVPGGGALRHAVGKSELAALGAKGWLVNVGRGDLVETDALIEALESKTIAGAALDVVEGEPKIPERLAALSNVILTPHIGGATLGARERGAAIAEDEVLAFLAQ